MVGKKERRQENMEIFLGIGMTFYGLIPPMDFPEKSKSEILLQKGSTSNMTNIVLLTFCRE